MSSGAGPENNGTVTEQNILGVATSRSQELRRQQRTSAQIEPTAIDAAVWLVQKTARELPPMFCHNFNPVVFHSISKRSVWRIYCVNLNLELRILRCLFCTLTFPPRIYYC